jgi:hypothetical protein
MILSTSCCRLSVSWEAMSFMGGSKEGAVPCGRALTGSVKTVSGPCTGNNTHCKHFVIDSRMSEMANPVEKYVVTATLLNTSCFFTLFSILTARVEVWSRLTPDSNNLIWRDCCLTESEQALVGSFKKKRVVPVELEMLLKLLGMTILCGATYWHLYYRAPSASLF